MYLLFFKCVFCIQLSRRIRQGRAGGRVNTVTGLSRRAMKYVPSSLMVQVELREVIWRSMVESASPVSDRARQSSVYCSHSEPQNQTRRYRSARLLPSQRRHNSENQSQGRRFVPPYIIISLSAADNLEGPPRLPYPSLFHRIEGSTVKRKLT